MQALRASRGLAGLLAGRSLPLLRAGAPAASSSGLRGMAMEAAAEQFAKGTPRDSDDRPEGQLLSSRGRGAGERGGWIGLTCVEANLAPKRLGFADAGFATATDWWRDEALADQERT